MKNNWNHAGKKVDNETRERELIDTNYRTSL